MDRLIYELRRFARDERATVTVEVVMVLPILLWGYFGLFVLFEAYRNLHANLNAAYTIGDLLSRETNGIDATYIEGLNTIQDILTQSTSRSILRVSVVSYDINNDDHNLEWSYSTLGKSALTQGVIDVELVPYLPPMFDGEQLIVVETWMLFTPFVDLYIPDWNEDRKDDTSNLLDSFWFEGISVTRPRFAGQLCWVSCAS